MCKRGFVHLLTMCAVGGPVFYTRHNVTAARIRCRPCEYDQLLEPSCRLTFPSDVQTNACFTLRHLCHVGLHRSKFSRNDAANERIDGFLRPDSPMIQLFRPTCDVDVHPAVSDRTAGTHNAVDMTPTQCRDYRIRSEVMENGSILTRLRDKPHESAMPIKNSMADIQTIRVTSLSNAFKTAQYLN